ncbi:hypothetical protein BV20DRAFT_967547 [Pilatotrama ljubarskyi]|nr:hypothetical protein BV20DRAFT_967547 [Pilatotrama ljubarskyi]
MYSYTPHVFIDRSRSGSRTPGPAAGATLRGSGAYQAPRSAVPKRSVHTIPTTDMQTLRRLGYKSSTAPPYHLKLRQHVIYGLNSTWMRFRGERCSIGLFGALPANGGGWNSDSRNSAMPCRSPNHCKPRRRDSPMQLSATVA